MLLWAMMKPLEAESQKYSHSQSLLSSHTVVSEFKPQGWGYESSSGGRGKGGEAGEGREVTIRLRGRAEVWFQNGWKGGKKVEGAGPREPEDWRGGSRDFLLKKKKKRVFLWKTINGSHCFEEERERGGEGAGRAKLGEEKINAARGRTQPDSIRLHRWLLPAVNHNLGFIWCMGLTQRRALCHARATQRHAHKHRWTTRTFDSDRHVRVISAAACVSLVLRCVFKYANVFHLGEVSQLLQSLTSGMKKRETCARRRTQAANHWALFEWSKWESFYFAVFAGNNGRGRRVSAKFKWVTQMCECVSREGLWLHCDCTSEILKCYAGQQGNQALTEVKCMHIYTFTLARACTYIHARMQLP